MKPLKHESLRESSGNGKVVRLISGLIDNRWLAYRRREKKFLVSVYEDKHEKYIPKYDDSKKKIDKLYIWKEKHYREMAGKPKVRGKEEQIEYARRKFKAAKKDLYWFDTFGEAQSKFIELSKKECGNIEKEWNLGASI